MLRRMAGRGCGRVVSGRAGSARGCDGTVIGWVVRASAVAKTGHQSEAHAGRVSWTRSACARPVQPSRTSPAAVCAPSRALGTVAAPDDVDGLRSLGRGAEADDARENVEKEVWRSAAGPTPEQSRLRAKFEEIGACEECVRRRADVWAELSGLHTQLQTKLSVGSTAVLPESWATPMLIGRGVVGADSVSIPGPPARWQLGHESGACSCCGGENHETSTRRQLLR